MSGSWDVRHIDLSQGPLVVNGSDRPQFLVFWWGGLPLGQRAFLSGEMPLSRAQIADILAGLAAEQALDRQGPLVSAGYDAHPLRPRPLAHAVARDGILADLDRLASAPRVSGEAVSVVICTRDRPAQLAACLASLGRQSSPPGEVVVVDNSAAGSARDVAQACAGVVYVHEPRPGLSIARNTGVAAASRDIIAFTDDDVEPSPDWISELARAFSSPQVQAATGLVLPARLDTPAQIAFQMDLGGFTSRFTPMAFGREFLEVTSLTGPQVWRIGAGANMAFRRALFGELGGFDERLGAGASGCSEDSEYWYRILAAGGQCLYEPRAVVFHHHREDMPGLRQQIRAYMAGHVAALVAQGDRYGDSGNFRRIFRQLPAYFCATALKSLQNLQFFRLALLGDEVRGWIAGLSYLTRLRWRAAGSRLPSPRRQRERQIREEVRHA